MKKTLAKEEKSILWYAEHRDRLAVKIAELTHEYNKVPTAVRVQEEKAYHMLQLQLEKERCVI